MEKKGVYIAIGLMCVLLTYGICMQMNTVKSFEMPTGGTATQEELKDEILRVREQYNNLYKELQNIDKELETARANSTKNNTELEEVESQIKEMNKLAGLTEVSGKGVKIVIEDSNVQIASNPLIDANSLIVHDKDILLVINELFNAGAEAISVNDIRIISSTAIECDGNIIKIGEAKINSPFVIKAIGYQETLASLNRTGGILESLRSRTLKAELTKELEIKIPRYVGTLKLNYVETD